MTTIPLPKSNSLPELPAIRNEEVIAPVEESSNEETEQIITQEMININHESRLQQIEACLHRIRGAI